MDKNIKYIIEKNINFNPVDYSDDEDNMLLSHHDVSDIIFNYFPKTRIELIKIIKTKIKENEFGDNELVFPNLYDINTSLIRDMSELFQSILEYNIKPIKLDLSSWNVSNVIDMSYMFGYCTKLIELNLSGWNSFNVKDMFGMFCGCTSLTKLDLSGFDTSNVTYMDSMFFRCESLKDIDLSGFDTSNATSMNSMFSSCKSL